MKHESTQAVRMEADRKMQKGHTSCKYMHITRKGKRVYANESQDSGLERRFGG